jgi:AcrR family transcriptional regulator
MRPPAAPDADAPAGAAPSTSSPGAAGAAGGSARAREVAEEARRLLEEEGAEALTMRRLAERLGIRAPTLYKHLPDKAAVEAAIIATGLEEAAQVFEAAVDGADDPLSALAAAYRGFALAHPHLYRLMSNGPLPRHRLPPGVEARAAAPVLQVAGTQARARALWAFAHGMVILELDHRFPPDADLDAAWQAGLSAFRSP